MEHYIQIDTQIIKNKVYKIKDTNEFPENTYFFQCEHSEKIQFSPWLTSNSGLKKLSIKACEIF